MADIPQANSKTTTRRQFLRNVSYGLAGVALVGGVWAHSIEPGWVEVTNHTIKIPHLPLAFDGFRIAQISDIHIEGGSMGADLPSICRMVNDQNADAIVVTGDYVTTPTDANPDVLARGLASLSAPMGVWGIMGNHDYWSGPSTDIVQEILAATPVQTLINQTHVWEKNGARLHLAGFDDFWGGTRKFDEMAAQIPDGEAAIALGHEPDFAIEVAATRKFGLMLSGHSHGGQIALPGGIPIHVPTYANKFPRGAYNVDGMRLYTNRGLGTVGIPMRFCSRPEISVFTLCV